MALRVGLTGSVMAPEKDLGLVFCLRVFSVPEIIIRFTFSRGYIETAWNPGDEVTRGQKREE